ncbi:MAG TPA: hypothetical protein VHI71_08240 [Actinomycetota bacterium]|nr:hypothetical protein [Actinomycetota bacterium]
MVHPEPQDRRPPIDERYRMFLRIAVVVAAYGAYLLVQRDGKIGAGALVGFGLIALGFATVDRLTRWRRELSEMMLVGTTLLGLGLLAVGLFLYLR